MKRHNRYSRAVALLAMDTGPWVERAVDVLLAYLAMGRMGRKDFDAAFLELARLDHARASRLDGSPTLAEVNARRGFEA